MVSKSFCICVRQFWSRTPLWVLSLPSFLFLDVLLVLQTLRDLSSSLSVLYNSSQQIVDVYGVRNTFSTADLLWLSKHDVFSLPQVNLSPSCEDIFLLYIFPPLVMSLLAISKAGPLRNGQRLTPASHQEEQMGRKIANS